MRRLTGILGGLALSITAALPAQTATVPPPQSADEVVARYVQTIGGLEKIQAVKTLKKTGRYLGGGGFEAKIVEDNKRPDLVREEFIVQGMVGVTAWDGKTGWKIEPFQGKKDVEALGEEEMKAILEDADFDGPLVGYKEKGNTIELAGSEPVEGTDAWKLKVTLKNGDVQWFFMDTDYFVPIKIEKTRIVRGAPRESEIAIGDYKEVAGVYYPHSLEQGPKGSSNKAKIVYDKIEANVPMDDGLFRPPASPTAPQAK